MTCEFCRALQKDGFRALVSCEGVESVSACPTKEVPKLCSANRRFLYLLHRILPGLFDGYGGMNYSAIETVLDQYGIEAGKRPVLMDKTLAVAAGIREVQKQEREAKKR